MPTISLWGPMFTAFVGKAAAIANVHLLGNGKLEFSRSEQGLAIQLPDRRPGEHAFTFVISGEGLV